MSKCIFNQLPNHTTSSSKEILKKCFWTQDTKSTKNKNKSIKHDLQTIVGFFVFVIGI
jgi:hypothetical protein